ncbi:hypothetical protein [Streptomyces canus]|uniref:hypothetical protein n=1 Tax=Streptomyces canus TaxID=58343 RepID=UPI003254E129
MSKYMLIASPPAQQPRAVRSLGIVGEDQADIDHRSVSAEEPSVDLRLSLQLGACVLVTEGEPGNGVKELLGRASDV